jgi:hypothetical protein
MDLQINLLISSGDAYSSKPEAPKESGTLQKVLNLGPTAWVRDSLTASAGRLGDHHQPGWEQKAEESAALLETVEMQWQAERHRCYSRVLRTPKRFAVVVVLAPHQGRWRLACQFVG